MNWYIVITEEFALSMIGRISENGGFNYAITLDNRYVCSFLSVRNFPEDFLELGNLTLVCLDEDDFPIQEENLDD